MTGPGYIGIVDLTVRLSSMNPLVHIDIAKANVDFERVVIKTCRIFYHKASSVLKSQLLEDGIILEGTSHKYFRFQDANAALEFSSLLRNFLVEARLPFKICLRAGELGGRTLSETWLEKSQILSNDEFKREAEIHFETTDPVKIKEIFALYRAPVLHDDTILLVSDLEQFKGFGLSIDPSVEIDGLASSTLFTSYQIASGTARKPILKRFLDCRMEYDANDVVRRYVAKSALGTDELFEDVPAVSKPLIDGTFELMRRSFKANENSGSYYVSMLTMIARSAHYGAIDYLSEPRHDPDSGFILASGLQGAPPILLAILDSRHRSMLRRTAGIELVIAALLDEFSRFVGALPANELSKHAGFSHVVHRFEGAFGDTVMRRVLSSPRDILSEVASHAVLTVISG